MFQISALIPTYNRSALVTRAVESVLAQSHAGPLKSLSLMTGSTHGGEENLRSYIAKCGCPSPQVNCDGCTENAVKCGLHQGAR